MRDGDWQPLSPAPSSILRGLIMSGCGTQRTNAADVTMSVVRGRPEVALPGRQDRFFYFGSRQLQDALRRRPQVSHERSGFEHNAHPVLIPPDHSTTTLSRFHLNH